MKRVGSRLATDGADNKKPRIGQSSALTYPSINPAMAVMPIPPHDVNWAQTTTAMSQYAGSPVSIYPGGYTGMTATAPITPQSAYFPPGREQGSNRTIYLGNVPKDTKPTEILNHIKSGLIESTRVLPDKNCAFVTFIDPVGAQLFYQEFLTKSLTLQNQDVKVGWGKSSGLSSTTKIAIQNGATRNVYLGNLKEEVTGESIRLDVSEYGEIDTIKLLKEKKIAFVHFVNITSAIACVASLPAKSGWSSQRVNFGKDRCNVYRVPNQPSQTFAFGNTYPPPGAFGMAPVTTIVPPMIGTSNTLYIGNIAPEATCEDLCNTIRGGLLYQIRYLPEKRVAFATFVDANDAANVFKYGEEVGMMLKKRRLRFGWGKNSNIPTYIPVAARNGASRNVYIGGVDESVSVEQLRKDFSVFGEIELVNKLKDKNCAFINFTSMENAIKAHAAMKDNSSYSNYKVSFGKDRCSSEPRERTTVVPPAKAPDDFGITC